MVTWVCQVFRNAYARKLDYLSFLKSVPRVLNIRDIILHMKHLHLYLHLGHLADAFIQSDLQLVHLS